MRRIESSVAQKAGVQMSSIRAATILPTKNKKAGYWGTTKERSVSNAAPKGFDEDTLKRLWGQATVHLRTEHDLDAETARKFLDSERGATYAAWLASITGGLNAEAVEDAIPDFTSTKATREGVQWVKDLIANDDYEMDC